MNMYYLNIICLCKLFLIVLGLSAAQAGPVTTSQTDYAVAVFPTSAKTLQDIESAWAVKWAFETHPTVSGEHVWVITDAYFLRKKFDVNKKSSFEWIRVVDRLAPAAMFVPYVEGGSRFKDIATYYTGIASLDQNAASQTSLRGFSVLHENVLDTTSRPVVLSELNDGHVRWMEVGSGGYHGVANAKRGEALTLTTMFSAVNYVYPTKYTFRDDGAIEVRMAASGQNLRDDPIHANTHLHVAAWSIELNLCVWNNSSCSPSEVTVKTVSRMPVSTGGGTQEEIVVQDFNGNVEGGVDWKDEEFTALLIQNPGQPNLRPLSLGSPPVLSQEPVGYALLPIRRGTASYKEPHSGTAEGFLDYDFWVTQKPSSPAVPETLFSQVQNYANGQTLLQQRKTIWHKTAYNHIPRYEDLGFTTSGVGFENDNGLALTTFAGFDLLPKNLMHITPGYK